VTVASRTDHRAEYTFPTSDSKIVRALCARASAVSAFFTCAW